MAKKIDLKSEIEESNLITKSQKMLLQEKASTDESAKTITPIEVAVTSMIIASPDDYTLAVELGGQIKSAQKFVEYKKDLLLKPIKELLKNTKDMFSPMEETLEKLEYSLKRKMMDFKEEERKKEALLMARLDRGTIKPETVATKLETMTEKTVRSATGAKATETWTTAYEVENESLIPREFLVPDMKKIKDSFKAGVPVAGIKEVKVQGVSF
jgi:hypothetical protein